MGKYKNDLNVTGCKSLLKAFTEELDSLGYEAYDLSENEVSNLNVFGFNGYATAPSTYAYSGTSINHNNQSQYTLPEQWNEALAAASELCVEEPKYKAGDWIHTNLIDTSDWLNDDTNRGAGFVSNTTLKIDHITHINSDHPIYWFYDHANGIYKGNFKPASREQIIGEIWSKLVFDIGLNKPYIPLRNLKPDEAEQNFSKRGVIHTGGNSNLNVTANNVQIHQDVAYDSKTDTLYITGLLGGFYVAYENGVYAKPLPGLPKINGYQGQFDGLGFIKFGCAYISEEWFSDLYKFLKIGSNRNIKEIVLDSNVTIIAEDLILIKEAIDTNNNSDKWKIF